MTRMDWLLLAIGDHIEPIQLQKTLFKFARESNAPKSEQYEFEAYNWGPMSRQIYLDLAELRSRRLVEFVPTGLGWNAYGLTPQGERRCAALQRTAAPQRLRDLDEKRSWVMQRPFRKLLRDVYRQYPAFAKKSMFKT